MEGRDALLARSLALPNGAATVVSGSLDLGPKTPLGTTAGHYEFLLTTPALTTAQLPDAATMRYDILGSANADLSAPTILIGGMNTDKLTQTGGGGAGAAGTTYRFRVATNAPRYVGYRVVNSNAANASAASALLEMLF